MLEFTLSDLNRKPGEIVEAALAGPVYLTRHGRRKLVILPVDRYEDLLQSGEREKPAQQKPAAGGGLASLNALNVQQEDWRGE